jgi:hypothetical protein
VIASGLDGPADIFFNAATDTLVIPNFQRNTLDFVRIAPPTISSVRTNAGQSENVVHVLPNPTHTQSTLLYTLTKPAHVALSISNTLGQVVFSVDLGHCGVGQHQHVLRLDSYSSGTYYCRVQFGSDATTTMLNVTR